MDVLLAALGPALAAGMALQRLLEILDGPIERAIKRRQPTKGISERQALKRLTNNMVALIVGVGLAYAFDLEVLRELGAGDSPGWLDNLVTGLIVSTGTEGVNSIVKFLGYKKEEKKEDAAKAVGEGHVGQVDRTAG